MSNNADTLDTQQVHTDGSNTSAKIQSPQTALPTSSPNEATNTIGNAAVFAGSTHAAPIQVRNGTAPLSFVPIGGTFTNDDVAPQAKPTSPSAIDKDGENHAPSP